MQPSTNLSQGVANRRRPLVEAVPTGLHECHEYFELELHQLCRFRMSLYLLR